MQRAGEARRLQQTAPLPTGRVTFLFTDIEGSTRRWESDSDAMKTVVARHDDILTAVMTVHHGHIFKTVGDAFCVAFSSAPAALAAAVDAQQAIAREDFSSVDGLRVRMALHSGVAHERGADYFGPSVNRVARLMSAGHGGQVLLSDATRALVVDQLPAGIELIDLGLHELKDLAALEHVWQLRIEGLPSEFAPLRSEGGSPNNLPAQATNFVGRDEDAREVDALLASHRLVTLVGAGGVGKTRLAIRVAEQALRTSPDGVWFSDFAPIADAQLVPSVVAKALGLTQQENRPIDDSLVQWLKRKQLLVILDNCEHVIAAAASLAASLIAACPGVRMLATSRQPLRIAGEAAYKLPSLPTPEPGRDLTVAAALEYAAIKLFVERAQAVDSRFALSAETAPVVAEICRRLDGIPLAIELAAARVRMLSVASIAGRLNERFQILTGGSRTALPRQQTLRALFDWSYELLDERERALFARVSVFAGGFSLAAASAVCADSEKSDSDALDLLASLVDKSLVVAELGDREERYALLESAREFALTKLPDAAEQDALASRHARFFCGMAQAADEASSTMPREALLAALEPDIDNFRAALEWTLKKRRNVSAGAAICGSLEQLWYASGLSGEGRSWIDTALACIEEREHSSALAARLWLARSLLFSGKGKFQSAERAEKLYRELHDELGAARSLRAMARGLLQMGRLDAAADAAARALPVLRAHADKLGEALCLNVMADVCGERGEIEAARASYALTLQAFEALGDQAGKAVVFIDLAELDFRQGDPYAALRHAQASIDIESRGKNATNLATAYSNTIAYHIALDDLAAASEAAVQALRWAQQAQSRSKVAWILQHCALIAAERKQVAAAARLLGYVDAQYAELGLERESTERWSHDRLAAILRGASVQSVAADLAEGATMSEERAIDEALTSL